MRIMLICALLLLLTGVSAAADVPKADAPVLKKARLSDEAAMAHFQLGVRAYEAGDWPVARIEFQAAYELSKLSDLLHNLSQVEENAGRIDAAIEYERRYLDSTALAADERQEAVDRIARLTRLRDTQSAAIPAQTPPPSPKPRRTPVWVPRAGLGLGIALLGASLAVLTAGQVVKNRIENEPTTLADLRTAQANAPVYLGFTLALAGSGAVITGLSVFGLAYRGAK